MSSDPAVLPDDIVESVGEFFAARGWEVPDCGPGGLLAFYPPSLGGADPDGPRRWLSDLGIARLFCVVTPAQVVEIESCGVLNGCRYHRVSTAKVPWADADGLHGALVRFERHARTIDLTSLAHCVLFGACSRRDFSLAERT